VNIKKELKNATFEWDEESKSLIVIDSIGNKVELNKIYSFALMRFIIRIAQKNFTKKTLQKESSLISIEENQEPPEDPRQIKFNF
tara:strand:+ start:752 stop:1006 length:255 start_codon:yes stop_codon:yes gene_type:complete